MPVRAATRAAMFGDRSMAVQVATMTRSTSSAVTPEFVMAADAALAAITSTGSSSSAMCRVWIPTRLRIHSSFVSTIFARSSLVSTLGGW